jgi:hypothetical protein
MTQEEPVNDFIERSCWSSDIPEFGEAKKRRAEGLPSCELPISSKVLITHD